MAPANSMNVPPQHLQVIFFLEVHKSVQKEQEALVVGTAVAEAQSPGQDALLIVLAQLAANKEDFI